MMSSLSYDITQRPLVISYRRFGKAGPIGCPQTSVNKYQSTLRNIPEEREPHLHLGGSLKQKHIWLERIHQPQIKTTAEGRHCKETRQSNPAGSVGSPTGYGQFFKCKLDSSAPPTDKPKRISH